MKEDERLKSHGVTWKSVAITLVLIPFNFYWIIAGEVGLVGYALNTYAVPFYNVVFVVFAFTLINLAVRYTSRIRLLTDAELLTIYILLSTACAFPSITLMTILVTTVGHAFWFATPENEWNQLFWDYLPRWLLMDDTKALAGYYTGETNLSTLEILSAWIVPILSWTLFITALVLVMLCINVILRKQWVERERLAYPITQIAFHLTHNTKSLFSHHMTWIGFGIAASIAILNGFSFLYPTIPSLPIKRIGGWQGFGHLFTEKPWNAIGGISMSYYPFVIGLGLLMPLDLSFSSWFFFFFYKAQLVFSSAVGLSNLPGFPYIDRQCFGAAIGIFISVLVLNGRHFRGVFRIARKRTGEDSAEPIPYRFALWGIVGGLAILFIFSKRIGMSLWLIPLFFAIYFIIVLVLTRMRAEQGFPVHAMENMPNHHILIDSFGTRTLGTNNLVALTLFRWFNRSYTSNPMPHQLEGFKLSERSNIVPRRLFFAILGISAFAAIMVFSVILYLFYTYGALNMSGSSSWSIGFGERVFSGLQRWLYYPTEPNFYATGGIVFGLLFSTLLMFMRARFFWWPFHPIGFVVSSDWGMRYLWSCMLVSSIVKWSVLRISGPRASQQLVMFAVGLMLGDFTVGGIWSLISVVTQQPMYNFWP